MEKNPADGLSFFLLETDVANRNFLGQIRHWDNLKVAMDGSKIYVRDFTPDQLKSPEVVTIPQKKIFEVRDNLMFPAGSLLPTRKFTGALLWTPIRRALGVELPNLNHNLFEVEGNVNIRIVASDAPQQEVGAVISRPIFEKYMKTAALVRIIHLSWTILDENILVFGTPLLPLPGISVWKRDNFLFPTGFEPEFPDLCDLVYPILAQSPDEFVLWLPDGRYTTIPKHKITPLSISSWRKTFAV